MNNNLRLEYSENPNNKKCFELEKENDLLHMNINEYRTDLKSTKEILQVTIRQVESLKLSKELHKDELQTMH